MWLLGVEKNGLGDEVLAKGAGGFYLGVAGAWGEKMVKL